MKRKPMCNDCGSKTPIIFFLRSGLDLFGEKYKAYWCRECNNEFNINYGKIEKNEKDTISD